MNFERLKRYITSGYNKRQGMVSHQIKPYKAGTANIEAKLMEKIWLCSAMYLRVFGTAKNLLTGKTYDHLIDNPDPSLANIDSTDWSREDWKRYTKDWNYYIGNIIELEKECEIMSKLLEKTVNAKQLESTDEVEENSQAEILGRWHFDSKNKQRKNNRR